MLVIVVNQLNQIHQSCLKRFSYMSGHRVSQQVLIYVLLVVGQVGLVRGHSVHRLYLY